MTEDRLRAAVAAAVVGSESAFAELLRSVAEVARAIFGARAASIFLLDEATDELVFEAVAGEGSDRLLGRRFPSSTGLGPRTMKNDMSALAGLSPRAIDTVPLTCGVSLNSG